MLNEMTDPVLVLCMKWGQLYGADYVNKLAHGVRRNLIRPHRFICFTDDSTGLSPEIETYDLPELGLPEGHTDSRWQKLGLFRQDLAGLQGTALFLDLDLVVNGPLDRFFDLPGAFRILRDDDLFRTKPLRWLNPTRDAFLHSVGNSSVFRFEIGDHSYILDAFVADPTAATARYKLSQQFQSAELAARGHLNYWPRGWCVSFKNDCVPRGLASWFRDPELPSDASIVVFAGNPKMGEVLAGGGQRWYRRIGKVDWLRSTWSEG